MALLLKNVSYSYTNKAKQKHKVISELNLTVNKGEFVTLIGKSGTGKSTILKLITGLLTQDEGEIGINGQAISLGDVGYMPQRDLLLPWRTIIDNIMLGTEIQKNTHVTLEEVRTWLDRVGLLAYENALPNQLSGGMRQRAAFLRAMLTGKDVMLLDEPFGALDALTKKEMQTWLLSIWQELDKTILFITHDLEEACFLSDRIILLHPHKSLEEILVELPRPRAKELLYSSALISLRQELEKKIAYDTCEKLV
ncbi:ABC transporter ATP-binding protein [Lederbergia lenta]|uniref:ABC transporter ATP-binding protein n=1 Tax=Lederbergia lenta TaxID=1467 RepID=UPI00203DB4FA|nr:ABC transporter ATP-binding protein [Lederbergia lenta]MCM3109519.1 ABC transporter ATP-binding protein [Lederbergia lenta]